MGKINYLLKRIRKMNYKQMFKAIEEINKETGKSKFLIFNDIIYCGFKYQAGYSDYKLFKMYDMNNKERATIITRGINNSIVKKYNDKNYIECFENKVLFNKLFNKYLNRDWLYLKEASLEDFKKFLKGKKEIIVKPLALSCGKNIEKIKLDLEPPENLYQRLLNSGQTLVEEVATQNEELNKIYPYAVNTLRVVTLKGKVVCIFLRIGNNGNVVDNFNHGGMVVPVEIDTGKINYPAIDKRGQVYDIHPMTKAKIKGAVIPKIAEVEKLCEDASSVVPEISYVAWDVCLGENKPCLIEGNDFPGHDVYQLPVHRSNNIGLLPVFEKIMKEEK